MPPLPLQELCVLIPSHSLEDFPTELSESDAESLLNAFVVAWHPALLVAAGRIPHWSRADEPTAYVEQKLFLAATACDGWMNHDWPEQARTSGAIVIGGQQTREEYLRELEKSFPAIGEADPALVRDFFALGLAWLMIELLTRKMHYFTSINESNLERDAVAAAQAALSGDETAMRAYLKGCFEVLLEAREHFYPTDSYLIDMSLLSAETCNEHLTALLATGEPINFLLKAGDLDELARSKPAELEHLRAAFKTGTACLVGGDRFEKPLSLLPLNSVLADLTAGHALYQAHCDRRPRTWGRKRFGFSPQLPQILTAFGYRAALHVALDDGLYPDEEQSKLRWEGCDGTVLDAITRIPLAADSASSFLRLPDRMAESMQNDQVAGILFARWPELKTEWMRDLRRIDSYLPVLGRFITFDDFVRETDHSGRLASHDAQEYLTPYLLQSVAFGEADGVSRYVRLLSRRHRFDRAAWLARLVPSLTGQTADRPDIDEWEQRVEASGPDPAPEGAPLVDEADVDAQLDAWSTEQATSVANFITQGGNTQRGLLVVNHHSFAHNCVVDLSKLTYPPALDDTIKAVQWDDRHRAAVVSLPGSGFLFIPDPNSAATLPKPIAAPADELALRNEFFEVLINSKTGGIQHLKNHGRSPNRLSQQTTFRFPRERTWTTPDAPEQEQRSSYAEMRMVAARFMTRGPAVDEIVTESEIVDQTNGTVLATCRQTLQAWRHLPYVDLTIELDPKQLPDGDPWSNYYAARLAWGASDAVLTGCQLQGSFPISRERIESPYYIEIADDQRRTTLLCGGLAFHRKSGPNMLDSILIAPGERARTFHLRIGFDLSYPLEQAHDLLAPPAACVTDRAPRGANSGWFFALKQSNVQIIALQPLFPPKDPEPGAPTAAGFGLRLLETEGRNRKVKLQLLRPAQRARIRDQLGETVKELTVAKDAVLIEMHKYQFADVEVFF